MKRLALALLALLLSGGALAQPPQIVQSEGLIELGVGESKTLRFQHPFKSWDQAIPDVVKFLPQSDRQLTVTGASIGRTLMFVFDDQGGVTYSATINVIPVPGHLVRIYGKQGKDFVGYYCSDTGCGRADLDKKLANGGRDPDDPTTIFTTQPLRGGGTITKRYRPD